MNTVLYNTKEARDQFSQIIKQVVDSGEAVWITKGKKAVVKIVPVEQQARHLGLLKNADFWIAPDFDETNDIIEALFYGYEN